MNSYFSHQHHRFTCDHHSTLPERAQATPNINTEDLCYPLTSTQSLAAILISSSKPNKKILLHPYHRHLPPTSNRDPLTYRWFLAENSLSSISTKMNDQRRTFDPAAVPRAEVLLGQQKDVFAQKVRWTLRKLVEMKERRVRVLVVTRDDTSAK